MILKIFGISNGSLYNWINKSGQLETKVKKDKLTPSMKCFILNYVLSRNKVDRFKLIDIIKINFNVTISESKYYRTLKELHVTKKKIRKKFDGLKKENEIKLTQLLRNKIGNNYNNLISIDETSVDTLISDEYGLSHRGKRITENFKVKKIRYTLVCAISNKKIIHCKLIENSFDAAKFKDFILETSKLLPSNIKHNILLDNASIHKAKIIKKYLSRYNKISFIYNVPYRPQYNPIEILFSKLKSSLKKFSNNGTNLIENIHNVFKNISEIELGNYYEHSKKQLMAF